jgi:hypothetical protein
MTVDPVEDLMPGAETCVTMLAEVKEDDHVLIVTDNTRIAQALSRALKKLRPQAATNAVECFYIGGLNDGLRPGKDLPHGLERALQQATIVFNAFRAVDEDFPLVERIIDSPKQRPRQKVFHFVSPEEHMFHGEGALGLSGREFDLMKRDTKNLAIALTIASKAEIKAHYGQTDLDVSLGGPENVAFQSTGQMKEGTWGNLPSGEAFVLPTSAKGRIIIDKAVGGFAPAFESFALSIDQGRVRVEDNPGPAGLKLQEILERHKEITRKQGWPEDNVRRICELGIGSNPKAEATHYPENEKILGTIHIAVGRNDIFGGPIKASTHIDMVVERPTVILDGRPAILTNGKLQRQELEDFPKINHETVDIDGMSPDQIVRVRRESVVPKDGYLLRKWTDKRSNSLEALVGYQYTAQQALQLWESFDDDSDEQSARMLVRSFKKQIKSTNNETATVLRLLRVMEQFGVVELSGSGN